MSDFLGFFLQFVRRRDCNCKLPASFAPQIEALRLLRRSEDFHVTSNCRTRPLNVKSQPVSVVEAIAFLCCSWLQPVNRGENESPEDFAKRVEKIVSESVGRARTQFTSHDAVEYAKRRILEEERRQVESRLQKQRCRTRVPSEK